MIFDIALPEFREDNEAMTVSRGKLSDTTFTCIRYLIDAYDLYSVAQARSWVNKYCTSSLCRPQVGDFEEGSNVQELTWLLSFAPSGGWGGETCTAGRGVVSGIPVGSFVRKWVWSTFLNPTQRTLKLFLNLHDYMLGHT